MEVLTAYSGVDNLVESIEQIAQSSRDDPYLVSMAERAKVVHDSVDRGQTSIAKALEELFEEIELNDRRQDGRARQIDTI